MAGRRKINPNQRRFNFEAAETLARQLSRAGQREKEQGVDGHITPAPRPADYVSDLRKKCIAMNKPFIKKLTQEEHDDIFNKAMEALDRDDQEEYDSLCFLLPVAPEIANILKRSGFEEIIASGINLIEAVEAYGEDWLNE